jgi:hypothetical protein
VSRQYVRQRQRNQDSEEQNSREDENFGKAAAVLYVHKKQNDQKHLHNGNGQSRNGVKRAEVNICDSGSERREQKKRNEDPDVDSQGNNVFGH